LERRHLLDRADEKKMGEMANKEVSVASTKKKIIKKLILGVCMVIVMPNVEIRKGNNDFV